MDSRNSREHPEPYEDTQSPIPNVIKRGIAFAVIIVFVFFCFYELLVYLYDDTDPDFENFYYVKISNPQEEPFQMTVPIPSPSNAKRNLLVDGNATINLTYPRELRIVSSAPTLFISSYLSGFDRNTSAIANFRLPAFSVHVNSTGEISVIVGALVASIYKDLDGDVDTVLHANLLHNTTKSCPTITKSNWKDPLSEQYFAELNNGWTDFSTLGRCEYRW